MNKAIKPMIAAIAAMTALGVNAQTMAPYAIKVTKTVTGEDGQKTEQTEYTIPTDKLISTEFTASESQVKGEMKMRMLFDYRGSNDYDYTLRLNEQSNHSVSYLMRDSRILPVPVVDGVYMSDPLSKEILWESVPGAASYGLRVYECVSTADGVVNVFKSENSFAANAPRIYNLTGLDYGRSYIIQFRAVSPDGEEFSSEWGHRHRPYEFSNLYPYSTDVKDCPKVLKLAGRGTDNIIVAFDLEPKAGEYYDGEIDADGKYKADKIVIAPKLKTVRDGQVVDESRSIELTAADKAAGFLKIEGLKTNVEYEIDIVNSSAATFAAGKYNTLSYKTLAEPTAPYLIAFKEDNAELNACDIYPLLSDYFKGNLEFGINQTFYLEGGKNYYFSQAPHIASGVTLATDPADVAQGKRAKVFLGDQTTPLGSLILGGEEAIFCDMRVNFSDIDFDVPGASNLAVSGGTPTGNYFINFLSDSKAVDIEALTIKNCTFRHFVRGFVRIQGSSDIKIKKIEVDGNLFYECGYHAATGNSYAWFASDGKVNHNMFENLIFTNNTIYNSPRVSLLTDNNKSYDFTGIKWNIKVENNTFVNFNILSKSGYLFNLRYLPETCHISFQRNLLVMTLDPQDSREPCMAGADVRYPGANFSYEFKDNYSVGYTDKHMTDDGIFTAGAFSATKNSFGKFADNNLGTADDLKVKVGTTPLKATELFAAPTPPYVLYNDVVDYSAAPDNIFEALKYQDTPAVRAHEIYTKNVGDPRWRF